MARRRFVVWNGATAAFGATAELAFFSMGANGGMVAASTLLQVKPTTNIAIIEWGFQLAVIPSAIVNVELITTGTVGAAAGTAFNAGDVVKYDDAGSAASAISLGTGASGFTFTTDAGASATRLLDQGPGWSQFYCKQFPLDREPGVQANDFLRIRAHSATAIGIKVYVVFEE